MKQLFVNKIKCPDGTVLISRHRHDFQGHVQEDGREYWIDGGLSYQRMGFSDNEYTDLTCYTDSRHEMIREHFEWLNSLDAEGNSLDNPRIVLLKDIGDEHLEALIAWTAEDYPLYIYDLFVDEKHWRNKDV